jgi:hypothetical protein
MSETYAEDYDPQTAGGFLVVAISILAGILVLAGLFYAVGTGARHKTALAVNNCEPNQSKDGLPCTTQQMVISQYEAIVNPANKQLTADAAAYTVNEGRHLAAAEAALTSAVATEQTLDNGLAAMAYTPQNAANALSQITIAADAGSPTPSTAILLTPQTTVIANALIQADQTFAKLLAEQARSSSLTQLRSFNARADAASAAVQTEMKVLRQALAAPITAAQEP